MRKILVYLKDYKKECFLAPFFKFLEVCLELAVPLIVASVIDAIGEGQGSSGFFWSRCAYLVLFGVLGLAVAVTAQYFSAKAATGFAEKLRYAIFSRIENMSFSQYDRIGASTLITRITSDVNQVQTGVNLTLRLVLRSPFVVIGALIMAFSIDAGLSIIFAVAIPVLAVIIFAIMLISLPLYRRVQGGLDKIVSHTTENLSGVRVIRAFNVQAAETEQYLKSNSLLTRLQLTVGRVSALLNPATYVVINLAVILLIKYGALSVNSGALTAGAVVALYNYTTQISTELIKLANLIINLTKALACGRRISAVLEEPSEPNGLKSGENGDLAVEFNSVELSYNGAAAESLKNISFSAALGETVGIIGSTGSGKSSLVNMIPAFYEATAGTVSVLGVKVQEWDKAILRGKIGLVAQRSVLFSGTLRENMQNSNENATDEEIYDALRIAQAFDFVNEKGKGLDLKVLSGGKNFSGGQRQRLSIARALVRKPEILILDDSSSALDYATDLALRNALKQLDYNPTVFIVSQRTASVKNADKIIVLEDGEIVGIGTHEQLLSTNEIYAEIHTSQFQRAGER